MKKEDFKNMMRKRFSLDGKEVKIVVENEELIQMETDISISGVPLKLIDDLYWRKEEIDFCQTLENDKVQYMGYYHRVSRAIPFDQRNFYFMIKGADGENYPNYISIYVKEGIVSIGKDKDFFFPRNDKQSENVDVLEEEIRILKALQQYSESKIDKGVNAQYL